MTPRTCVDRYLSAASRGPTAGRTERMSGALHVARIQVATMLDHMREVETYRSITVSKACVLADLRRSDLLEIMRWLDERDVMRHQVYRVSTLGTGAIPQYTGEIILVRSIERYTDALPPEAVTSALARAVYDERCEGPSMWRHAS